jgi:hypothetical protein
MPLNVICRLNKKFTKALVDTDCFRIHDSDTIRKITDGDYVYFEVSRGETMCCGIEELDFTYLNENYRDALSLKNKDWNSLIAKYIKCTCDRPDPRVVFVGIPTRVGSQSMYSIEFYKRLRKTLNEFGFRELCKPYKNLSSGNHIVVLAGQMPSE